MYIGSISVSAHKPCPCKTPRPLPCPCETPRPLPGPVLAGSGAVRRSSSKVMYTLSCPGTYSTLAYVSSLVGGGRLEVGPLFGLRPGTCRDPLCGFALVAEAILRDLWTRPSGFSCSVKHTYNMSGEHVTLRVVVRLLLLSSSAFDACVAMLVYTGAPDNSRALNMSLCHFSMVTNDPSELPLAGYWQLNLSIRFGDRFINTLMLLL